MVSSKGKEGLALLAVVIVVVAALGVAVVVKDYNNDKDNPNGILGTYVVADYAQYGTQNYCEDVQWYVMGDSHKAFDDQKLTIESYKDGFIKVKTVNGPYSFDMAGYYDPDTGAFGLGATYNYTPPEGNQSITIDSIRGMIVGDTMYYSGYLSSHDDAVAYVYNFTCVKEGKQASLINYQKVLSPNQFETKQGYYFDEEGFQSKDIVSFNIASGGNSFNKGVYVLETYVGTEKITGKGMAATVYQDNTRTILRSIAFDSKNAQYFGWIIIENGNMYACEYKVDWDNGFCHTYVYSTEEAVTSSAQDALIPAVFEMKMFSSMFGHVDDNKDTLAFVAKYESTKVAYCYGQPIYFNESPSQPTVVFSYIGEGDSADYYCDMFAVIDGNGLKVYGLMFGSNLEAVASIGTIKPVSA